MVKNPRSSILLFFSLVFLGAVNSALLAPHEIHLARDLRTSIFAVDLVMFLYMAVPAFFLPAWGYLCDRLGKGGRKTLLAVGAALWSLSSFVIYVAASYPVFLVARVLIGVGVIVVYPLGYSIITDLIAPRDRGKALASFLIITVLGVGMGVVFASLFGELVWRPQFLIIGIAGLAALSAFMLFFQEPARGASEPELMGLVGGEGACDYRINAQKLLRILKVRTNRWLLIAKVFWRIPLGVYAFKLLPYLEMSGFDPAAKTTFALLVGSGSIFGYSLGGMLGDWANGKREVGRVSVSIFSLSLAALLLLSAWLIPLSPEIWSAGTLRVVFLGFAGAVLLFVNVPNLDAIVGDVNEPEARGMLISLLNSLGWLGFGLGILGGGIGVQPTLSVYRTVLVCGTLGWFLAALCLLPIYWSVKADTARFRQAMAQRAREMKEGRQ